MNHPTTPRGPVAPGPRAATPNPARAHDRRRGYGPAVLIAVIGATAAAVWAVTGFLDQVQHPEQFARTAAPGSTSVAITQTGSHVIYVEGAGPADLTAADLTVSDPRGDPVQVHPYALDLRYDVPGAPGVLGTAVAVFGAERTGTYRVGTDAVVADGTTTLAVGDDLAPEVIRSVAVPSAVGVLVLLAGIGVGVATWIHDERRTQS
jgi:hypothetical protein